MNFNIATLLPLIAMMGGKEGDAQGTLDKIAKMQSGDTSALLDMFGGGDEKTKSMMGLFQMLPAMMGMMNGSNGVPDKVTAQSASAEAPPDNPIDIIANNEINSALQKMLK